MFKKINIQHYIDYSNRVIESGNLYALCYVYGILLYIVSNFDYNEMTEDELKQSVELNKMFCLISPRVLSLID